MVVTLGAHLAWSGWGRGCCSAPTVPGTAPENEAAPVILVWTGPFGRGTATGVQPGAPAARGDQAASRQDSWSVRPRRCLLADLTLPVSPLLGPANDRTAGPRPREEAGPSGRGRLRRDHLQEGRCPASSQPGRGEGRPVRPRGTCQAPEGWARAMATLRAQAWRVPRARQLPVAPGEPSAPSPLAHLGGGNHSSPLSSPLSPLLSPCPSGSGAEGRQRWGPASQAQPGGTQGAQTPRH